MSYEIVKGRYAISHKYTTDHNEEKTALIYLSFESSNNISPRTFDGHVVAVSDDSWRNSLPSKLYKYAECCDNGSVKLYNGNTTSEAWISHWKKEQETPIPYDRIGFSFRASLYINERYKGKILSQEITGYHAASILNTLETIYKIKINEPLTATNYFFCTHLGIDEVIAHFTDGNRYPWEKTGISFGLSVSNYIIERLSAERRRLPYKTKSSKTNGKKWKSGDHFTNGKAIYVLGEKITNTRWSCYLPGHQSNKMQVTCRMLNRMTPVDQAQAA